VVTVQLTTNPGLEDLVVAELRAAVGDGSLLRAAPNPDGLAGHLLVEVDAAWTELRPALCGLRSVHRAIRWLDHVILDGPDPLAQIQRAVSDVVPRVPELDHLERSFRVTSSRTGTHPFTSEDVQRVAGAGVRAVARHPVSLRDFDVEIRCDVRDRTCRIGVQLGGLSRRPRGPYAQRTSLRGNVAWALLELVRPDGPPARLLDPFCGSGTLLVEARARWPTVWLAGLDRDEAAALGTRDNLLAAGPGEPADVRHGDARALERYWSAGTFDTIVGNPPFGRRMGRDLDLVRFYADVLRSVAIVCEPGARMVLLVHRRRAFNAALRTSVWTTRHVRVIEVGGLYVGAFVLGCGKAG